MWNDSHSPFSNGGSTISSLDQSVSSLNGSAPAQIEDSNLNFNGNPIFVQQRGDNVQVTVNHSVINLDLQRSDMANRSSEDEDPATVLQLGSVGETLHKCLTLSAREELLKYQSLLIEKRDLLSLSSANLQQNFASLPFGDSDLILRLTDIVAPPSITVQPSQRNVGSTTTGIQGDQVDPLYTSRLLMRHAFNRLRHFVRYFKLKDVEELIEVYGNILSIIEKDHPIYLVALLSQNYALYQHSILRKNPAHFTKMLQNFQVLQKPNLLTQIFKIYKSDNIHDGLWESFELLTSIELSVRNVKAFREDCDAIYRACRALFTRMAISFATDSLKIGKLRLLLLSIHRTVTTWPFLTYNAIFERFNAIGDAIDGRLVRLDALAAKLSLSVQLPRVGGNSAADRGERDRREISKLLKTIIDSSLSVVDYIPPPDISSSSLIIETIQAELWNPSLKAEYRQSFLDILSTYDRSLIPFVNLTGQITECVIPPGTAAQLGKGNWLRQPVGLRAIKKVLSKDKSFLETAASWRKLQHENVVPFLGVAQLNQAFFSITPWMECLVALSKERILMIGHLKILLDVASGLGFLHSNEIIHGDVRAASIMITSRGVACLSNYGLTPFLHEMDYEILRHESLRWMAPELFDDDIHSPYSDIWSFGVLAFEVFTREIPYSDVDDDEDIVAKICGGESPLDYWRNHSATASQSNIGWPSMRKCWTPNPKSRPTIASLMASLVRQEQKMKQTHILTTAQSVNVPSSAHPSSFTSLIETQIHQPRSPSSVTSANQSITTNSKPLPPRPPSQCSHSSPAENITPEPSEHLPESTSIFNLDERGNLRAGNLDGFVDYWIQQGSDETDHEFGLILVLAATEFSDPQELFCILQHRFEAVDGDLEVKYEIQARILSLLHYWMMRRDVYMDEALLKQLKALCDEHPLPITHKARSTNGNKSERSRSGLGRFQSVSWPRSRNTDSLPTPSELALAFSSLERNLYKKILPTDYLSHLTDQPAATIRQALEMNKKIYYWVLKSILEPEKYKDRGKVLVFFINTANSCHQNRNDSTFQAIRSAIQSREIQDLRLTLNHIPEHLLDLMKSFQAFPSYQSQRPMNGLRKPPPSMIPPLQTVLQDLEKILEKNPKQLVISGMPLINLQRYQKFTERLQEVLKYDSQDSDQQSSKSALEYLNKHLRDIDLTQMFEQQIEIRAEELFKKERASLRNWALYNRLGFRQSSRT